MKKLLTYTFIIVSLFFVYSKRNDIYKLYMHLFDNVSYSITTLEKNKYYQEQDYKYVKITDKFVPENKQDILNIYYTVVNSGMNEFTFYCDDKYVTCLNDIENIANDQTTISTINNFVHPFNSFSTIETEIDSRGIINLKINHVYSDEMKILINYKVDELYKELYKDNVSVSDNIKAFHDYIIDHTEYDKERADSKIVKYKSDNAYGVLIEGIGLCGGYTDTMSLFLDKLNVKNYKVSTNNHTWNRVFINDKWLHLDLTWDDPISEDGKNILDHNYFLITTNELKDIEKNEHNYNTNIYDN